MPKMDLSKYGIKSVKEVLYNPTYEVLYNEETKPELEAAWHAASEDMAKAAQQSGPQGPQNPEGPQGPQNPEGPQGPAPDYGNN